MDRVAEFIAWCFATAMLLAPCFGLYTANVKEADNGLERLGSSEIFAEYNPDGNTKMKHCYINIVSFARSHGYTIEQAALRINVEGNLSGRIEKVTTDDTTVHIMYVYTEHCGKVSHHRTREVVIPISEDHDSILY